MYELENQSTHQILALITQHPFMRRRHIAVMHGVVSQGLQIVDVIGNQAQLFLVLAQRIRDFFALVDIQNRTKELPQCTVGTACERRVTIIAPLVSAVC